MKSLVIVDDEIRICNLISKLIHYDAFGLKLAGTFQSGKAFFDFCENNKVDLLICDIEMPEMSGIDVLKKLQSKYPNCKSIIVSGFRNFEYAQQALLYKASRYILKPIDETELNEAIADILGNENDSVPYSSEAASSLRQSILTLVEQDNLPSEENEVNRQYSLHFQPGCYNVFRFFLASKVSDGFIDSVQFEIMGQLRKLVYDAELIKDSGHSCIILANYQQEYRDQIIHLLMDKLSLLHGKLSPKLFLAVGDEKKSLSQLADAYKEAVFTSWQRMNYQYGSIIYTDPVAYTACKNEKISLSLQQRNDMQKAVEKVDSYEVETVIRNIFAENSAKLTEYPALYPKLSRQILITMFQILYSLNITDNDQELRRMEFEQTIVEVTDREDLIKKLMDLVHRGVFAKLNKSKEEDNILIRNTKKYIDEHFYENITLEVIAEKLQINASYLSYLFKEELHINYLKYLTNVRISKAKEMLVNTSDNLSQISYAVGYKNPFYFNQIFTREVGIKPKEFRKLHQSGVIDNE